MFSALSLSELFKWVVNDAPDALHDLVRSWLLYWNVDAVAAFVGCLTLLVAVLLSRLLSNDRKASISEDAAAFLKFAQSRSAQNLEVELGRGGSSGVDAETRQALVNIAKAQEAIMSALQRERETNAAATARRFQVEENMIDCLTQLFNMIGNLDNDEGFPVLESPVLTALKDAATKGLSLGIDQHAAPAAVPKHVPPPLEDLSRPESAKNLEIPTRPTPPQQVLHTPVSVRANLPPIPPPTLTPLALPQTVPRSNSGPISEPPIMMLKPKNFAPQAPRPTTPTSAAPVKERKFPVRPATERPKPVPIVAISDPFAAARAMPAN